MGGKGKFFFLILVGLNNHWGFIKIEKSKSLNNICGREKKRRSREGGEFLWGWKENRSIFLFRKIYFIKAMGWRRWEGDERLRFNEELF